MLRTVETGFQDQHVEDVQDIKNLNLAELLQILLYSVRQRKS